ncbi:MAG: nuclear transport factor 2 family protein [Bacteroidota bacterium]
MTKVTLNANLENSAEKEFLKSFNVAFAEGNAGYIIDHVSDDIQWTIYGDKKISGKEDFTKEINIMKEYTADEVTIHSIITNDLEASLNGEMKMGDKVYAFCDVYKFTNVSSYTIEEMHSYVLPI